MKTLSRLLLFFCAILIVACDKQASSEIEKQALIGTWKLAETLADPGDGSGTWQPVPPASQTDLTFYADGNMESTAFTEAKRYTITSQSNITFTFTDGTFINYTYALTGSVLEISTVGCVEACGARFRKVTSQNQ